MRCHILLDRHRGVCYRTVETFNNKKVRIYPLFRVMEIQRIYEVTATPLHGTENWSQQGTEGASLSEEPGDRFIEQ